MANKKITDLPELAEAPNDNDLFEIVDISTGESKRIKAQYLGGGAGSTPTLDEVLTEGNTTDLTAIFEDTYNKTVVLTEGVTTELVGEYKNSLIYTGFTFEDLTTLKLTTLLFTNPTGSNGLIYIPDVVNSTETLALLSDIPPAITIDAVPTDGSTNAVSSNGVFDALALKQNVLTNPVTGTGATGQVSFWDGTNSQTGDNTLFWDNTNKRLRINQLTDAGFRLDVNGTARVQGNLTLTAGASSSFRFNSSVFIGRIGLQNLINQDTFFDLFTNLGDGTKSAGFAIWAKGTPSSVTNSELLEFRYDGVNSRYSLNIIQSGTGTLRPFHLYIGTNTNQLKLQTNGNVSINSASDNASAQLQVDSTTRGFLPPRMTTIQKNAIATPTAGLVVYDTTLNKLCVYTTVWETITSL
jgi:hypothetical protein